jgi:hypothetical protein
MNKLMFNNGTSSISFDPIKQRENYRPGIMITAMGKSKDLSYRTSFDQTTAIRLLLSPVEFTALIRLLDARNPGEKYFLERFRNIPTIGKGCRVKLTAEMPGSRTDSCKVTLSIYRKNIPCLTHGIELNLNEMTLLSKLSTAYISYAYSS